MILECLTLTFLCALLANIFYRQESKSSDIKRLPRVKYTFISLPLLDGYITLLKLKLTGLNGLRKVAQRYGKIFTLPVADTDAVFISDPDMIQKVLKSTENGHLNKVRDFYDVVFSEALRDGLTLSDVETWAPHRKVLSRAFTYKSFPGYLTIINNEACELIQKACSITAKNLDNIISLGEMTKLIDFSAIKMTAEILMGVDVVRAVPEKEYLQTLTAYKRAEDICAARINNPALLLKPIWMIHPKKRELTQVIQTTKSFLAKLSSIYKTNENTGENDTIGCAMEEMIKANLTDGEIADEIAMLMAAGHDTTVTSLHFLIFHLAANPLHQEMCYAEAKKFFESKDDHQTNCYEVADYSELKYLERCIFESLRITPTVPAFARRIDTPLEISKFFSIQPGTNLVISPWLIHRDPEIYPNPELFDPNRFLSENIKQRHSHSYLPFSLGPRNCIAWKLALLEMKVTMAWILKEFEFITTDKPDDYELVIELTVKPKREFNVMLKRREA